MLRRNEVPRRGERRSRRDYDNRNSTLISTKSVPGGSVALIIRPVRGLGRPGAERGERLSLLSAEEGRSVGGTPQAARRAMHSLSPEAAEGRKDVNWKYQKGRQESLGKSKLLSVDGKQEIPSDEEDDTMRGCRRYFLMSY